MEPDGTEPTTSPPVGVREVSGSERQGIGGLAAVVAPEVTPKLSADFTGATIAERVQEKRRSVKAEAKPEATPTEDAPQMRKQDAQQFFLSKNREVATKAVAADPETAKLRGRDKEKVSDSVLTRGAFSLHELCLSRVAFVD